MKENKKKRKVKGRKIQLGFFKLEKLWGEK
jgi:hypothetical protein